MSYDEIGPDWIKCTCPNSHVSDWHAHGSNCPVWQAGNEVPEPDAATLAWARGVSQGVQALYAANKGPVPDAYAMELIRRMSGGKRELPAPELDAAELTEPAEPADPAAEIQAALRQYDADTAAGQFTLPDAPAREPGTCAECGLPTGDPGVEVCRFCALRTIEGTIAELDAIARRPVTSGAAAEQAQGLVRHLQPGEPLPEGSRESPAGRRFGLAPGLATLVRMALIILVGVTAAFCLAAMITIIWGA